MTNFNRWLEWGTFLDKANNKLYLDLYEVTQYDNDDNAYCHLICTRGIRIWPWTTKHSLATSLNKTQRKMLIRYSEKYNMWNQIETDIIPGWNGGTIVLEDIETYNFIKNRSKKKPALKVVKDDEKK